jgi:hypothetical protein
MSAQNGSESLFDFFNILFSTASEKFSACVSAVAISFPLWKDILHSTSDTASLLAPILGCVWLVVQIIHKLRELHKLPRKPADDE